MSIETLQTFLGWNLIIHTGMLLFVVLMLTLARSFMIKMHQSMFALSDEQLLRVYFNFIAAYKILVIIFVLVPYVVIRFLL